MSVSASHVSDKDTKMSKTASCARNGYPVSDGGIRLLKRLINCQSLLSEDDKPVFQITMSITHTAQRIGVAAALEIPSGIGVT